MEKNKEVNSNDDFLTKQILYMDYKMVARN